MADGDLNPLSSEEITAKNEAQASLETVNEITLGAMGTVAEVSIPSDLKITAVSVSAPVEVSFSAYDGTEESNSLTDLNKPTETLKDSINTNLVGFQGNIKTAINQLGSEIGQVNANIRLKTNEALSSVRADANQGLGDLYAIFETFKDAHKVQEEKIKALDTVYATDTDIAGKTAKLLEITESFSGVNTTFFDNFTILIDQINSTEITKHKKFVISSATGTANFNLALNGFGEFSTADKFTAKIESVSAKGVEAHIPLTSMTATGFDIELISKRFLIDKPHDASLEEVTVIVSISNALRQPFVIGSATDTDEIIREDA